MIVLAQFSSTCLLFHNAPPDFCNKTVYMHVHFCYTWCIVGHLSDALLDLWNGSILTCSVNFIIDRWFCSFELYVPMNQLILWAGLSVDIFCWGSRALTIGISKDPSIDIHCQFSNFGGSIGPSGNISQGPHRIFRGLGPLSPGPREPWWVLLLFIIVIIIIIIIIVVVIVIIIIIIINYLWVSGGVVYCCL